MHYTVTYSTVVILSYVSFHFHQTESRTTPRPTIVWRKAISRIDAAIKVTECGNRAKRRYTVREIPSKRRARVAINLPDRSTVAISNVSGVARHTSSNSITLQVAAITESNTNEHREIEKNWLIPLARESLNYYPGSELYIFLNVHTHTHTYVCTNTWWNTYIV